MNNKTIFTHEGRKKFKNDLNFLKGEETRRLLEALAEAREKGDISENSEYSAAKEEYERLQSKIVKLEAVIANSVVINTENINTDTVSVLTTVRVLNTKNQKEMVFTIVPENEIDLKNGKISLNSPIGKSLIGKKVDESVIVNIPAGLMELKVIEITI